MIQDAKEARLLAEVSGARLMLMNRLIAVENAAKDGAFEVKMGSITQNERAAFKLLGFKVEDAQSGAANIRWGT